MKSLKPIKRQLPKLMACMTTASLENLRNKMLFSVEVLDSKGIRRRKLPLHECLILELKESGYEDSADYLRDLIHDNQQLLDEDEIGIVVDLKKRGEYLEHISQKLQTAETFRDRGDQQKECIELLKVALHYSEKEKGILWLAEKFFLASIAIGNKYLLDGGRQGYCCKFYYAKFLLDKFPEADTDEAFELLTQVRDGSVGKEWLLQDPDSPLPVPVEKAKHVFPASALQLYRILKEQIQKFKNVDPAKAERLSRLAQRRAEDAGSMNKLANAVVELGICQTIMNNLNNALKSFDRAMQIYAAQNNIHGICETKMHMSAVYQKMHDTEKAAKLLTEMGELAMKSGLRKLLGRALHLLGELHLRTDRPDLGTQHLQEALVCFMGFTFQTADDYTKVIKSQEEMSFTNIFNKEIEVFLEDAEKTRLMIAVSKGQEDMGPYFGRVQESAQCAVKRMEIIEWKLSKTAWRYKGHEDSLACPCPKHNRTPLDVIKYNLMKKSLKTEGGESDVETGEIDITKATVDKLRLNNAQQQSIKSILRYSDQ